MRGRAERSETGKASCCYVEATASLRVKQISTASVVVCSGQGTQKNTCLRACLPARLPTPASHPLRPSTGVPTASCVQAACTTLLCIVGSAICPALCRDAGSTPN